MLPSDIQKRLALKLKLNKIDDCGIAASILLNEILAKSGHTTRLVQGYCSLSGETCWHVWVEVESSKQKLDIGYTIACLQDREFENCTPLLHTGLAPGSKEPKSDTVTLENWELYKKDSKGFWKKQSTKVQNFRAKVLHEKFC